MAGQVQVAVGSLGQILWKLYDQYVTIVGTIYTKSQASQQVKLKLMAF